MKSPWFTHSLAEKSSGATVANPTANAPVCTLRAVCAVCTRKQFCSRQNAALPMASVDRIECGNYHDGNVGSLRQFHDLRAHALGGVLGAAVAAAFAVA